MEAASPQIPVIAYRVAWPAHELTPASSTRAWMDRTDSKWAYRCLPLLMANQAGWFILNAEPVDAVWHGGHSKQDLEVFFSGKYKSLAPHSHFGYGVLTWNFPWLFRTPPGYNLVARGPTNSPKDGISALDGIIETDWASASFSMNWKFTRPGVRVRFEAGEPLCMIYPQKRYELERVSPELRVIQSDPELEQKHAAWGKSRAEFQQAMELSRPKARSEEWQKHYFLGRHVAGGGGSEHQNKLTLQCFFNHLPQDELPVTIAPDVTLPPMEMEQTRCAIASVLHQIVPPSVSVRFEQYRRTWTEQNPDWETRLWTLESGRAFLSDHHEWFLPLYDSYPQDRMRADVLRYFLLYTFGGVYADLDTECLQPFRTLLEGKQLVVGCERDEHVGSQGAHKAGLSWLISNSVVCSVPGHAFWSEVFRNLAKYGYRRNPHEATGSILLTRAYESFGDRSSIYLLDSAVLSPLPDREADMGSGDCRSFVLPHLDAECHFEEFASEPPEFLTKMDELDVNLLVQGRVVSKTSLRVPVINQLASARVRESTPIISCLMVARSNPALAMLSIRSFQQQTWQNLELVVADAGIGTDLERSVAELGDRTIRYCRTSFQTALAEASGDWIAYWPEDELSHPQRLELQFAAVETLSAGASFLQRRLILNPAEQGVAMSRSRVWETTLFCRRDQVFKTSVFGNNGEISVALLKREQRIAMVDRALLCLEVRHSSKLVNPKWDEASTRFDEVASKQIRESIGASYPLRELGKIS